ncbi:hypothetical protein NMG60_11021500 [Bertholletia excelsa]
MVGRISNSLQSLKPVMLMVMLQAAVAGVNIFYKLASNDGMSMKILIAYRFLFAAAFIIPIAFFAERKTRPKLTSVVAFQAFLSGLLNGSMSYNLYAESLVLTSATFAAAMANLIPAITFALAVTFKLDKLAWRTSAGRAKVAGTILCIGGAMVLTFYKGAVINIWSTGVDLLTEHVASQRGNQVLGAILVVLFCVSSAAGLILQAKMMKKYPCPYSTAALMMIAGAVQSVAFALCVERHPTAWKLGWDIRLLSTVYSGIVGGGVSFTLMAWCLQMRGPVFVSVFNPLMLVMVAIAGSLLLNEKLHVGSVVGAVVIVCGLYVVLWGKGKELKRITKLPSSESSREAKKSVGNIVTNPTDEDDNNVSRSSSNILVVGDFPGGVPMLLNDDALDDDTEVPEKKKDLEEDKDIEAAKEERASADLIVSQKKIIERPGMLSPLAF